MLKIWSTIISRDLFVLVIESCFRVSEVIVHILRSSSCELEFLFLNG